MILKALNVKNIVNTELEAAEKVLLKLVWELEMEVIPIDKEHSVAHFILANEWWCETNSVEKFCEKYLINIIAIKRNDKFILLERSTELLLNDELFCFANYKQLRIIQKCKNMEEINN
jgi:Trk K+ transport system NAD-binding subunit